MIYFIRAVSGPVKIGWTTSSIKVRLAALQLANHERLVVVRTLDGARSVELRLHQHYRPLRIHGEWYRWDVSMLTVQPGTLVYVPNRREGSERRRRARERRERVVRAAAAGWPNASIAAAAGLSLQWVALITKFEPRGRFRFGPLSPAEFLNI